MDVAFVMLHGGSEEIVVRAMTKEALDKFVETSGFRTHPRLRRKIITGFNDLTEIKGRMG